MRFKRHTIGLGLLLALLLSCQATTQAPREKDRQAQTYIEQAKAYEDQLAIGNKMMITLAGAMSTAELGLSLAEMIRQDKVHIITCTGANLEEDIFNLVAHDHYKRIPDYRNLVGAWICELGFPALQAIDPNCLESILVISKVRLSAQVYAPFAAEV